jgi:hypothetical protein
MSPRFQAIRKRRLRSRKAKDHRKRRCFNGCVEQLETRNLMAADLWGGYVGELLDGDSPGDSVQAIAAVSGELQYDALESNSDTLVEPAAAPTDPWQTVIGNTTSTLADAWDRYPDRKPGDVRPPCPVEWFASCFQGVQLFTGEGVLTNAALEVLSQWMPEVNQPCNDGPDDSDPSPPGADNTSDDGCDDDGSQADDCDDDACHDDDSHTGGDDDSHGPVTPPDDGNDDGSQADDCDDDGCHDDDSHTGGDDDSHGPVTPPDDGSQADDCDDDGCHDDDPQSGGDDDSDGPVTPLDDGNDDGSQGDDCNYRGGFPSIDVPADVTWHQQSKPPAVASQHDVLSPMPASSYFPLRRTCGLHLRGHGACGLEQSGKGSADGGDKSNESETDHSAEANPTSTTPVTTSTPNETASPAPADPVEAELPETHVPLEVVLENAVTPTLRQRKSAPKKAQPEPDAPAQVKLPESPPPAAPVSQGESEESSALQKAFVALLVPLLAKLATNSAMCAKHQQPQKLAKVKPPKKKENQKQEAGPYKQNADRPARLEGRTPGEQVRLIERELELRKRFRDRRKAIANARRIDELSEKSSELAVKRATKETKRDEMEEEKNSREKKGLETAEIDEQIRLIDVEINRLIPAEEHLQTSMDGAAQQRDRLWQDWKNAYDEVQCREFQKYELQKEMTSIRQNDELSERKKQKMIEQGEKEIRRIDREIKVYEPQLKAREDFDYWRQFSDQDLIGKLRELKREIRATKKANARRRRRQKSRPSASGSVRLGKTKNPETDDVRGPLCEPKPERQSDKANEEDDDSMTAGDLMRLLEQARSRGDEDLAAYYERELQKLAELEHPELASCPELDRLREELDEVRQRLDELNAEARKEPENLADLEAEIDRVWAREWELIDEINRREKGRDRPQGQRDEPEATENNQKQDDSAPLPDDRPRIVGDRAENQDSRLLENDIQAGRRTAQRWQNRLDELESRKQALEGQNNDDPTKRDEIDRIQVEIKTAKDNISHWLDWVHRLSTARDGMTERPARKEFNTKDNNSGSPAPTAKGDDQPDTVDEAIKELDEAIDWHKKRLERATGEQEKEQLRGMLRDLEQRKRTLRDRASDESETRSDAKPVDEEDKINDLDSDGRGPVSLKILLDERLGELARHVSGQRDSAGNFLDPERGLWALLTEKERFGEVLPNDDSVSLHVIKALILTRETYVSNLRGFLAELERLKDLPVGEKEVVAREYADVAWEVKKAYDNMVVRYNDAKKCLRGTTVQNSKDLYEEYLQLAAEAKDRDDQEAMQNMLRRAGETGWATYLRCRTDYMTLLDQHKVLGIKTDGLAGFFGTFLFQALVNRRGKSYLAVFDEYLRVGIQQAAELADEAEQHRSIEELWQYMDLKYRLQHQDIRALGRQLGTDYFDLLIDELECARKTSDAEDAFYEILRDGSLAALAAATFLIPVIGPFASWGVLAVDPGIAAGEVAVTYLGELPEAERNAFIHGQSYVADVEDRLENSIDKFQMVTVFSLGGEAAGYAVLRLGRALAPRIAALLTRLMPGNQRTVRGGLYGLRRSDIVYWLGHETGQELRNARKNLLTVAEHVRHARDSGVPDEEIHRILDNARKTTTDGVTPKLDFKLVYDLDRALLIARANLESSPVYVYSKKLEPRVARLVGKLNNKILSKHSCEFYRQLKAKAFLHTHGKPQRWSQVELEFIRKRLACSDEALRWRELDWEEDGINFIFSKEDLDNLREVISGGPIEILPPPRPPKPRRARSLRPKQPPPPRRVEVERPARFDTGGTTPVPDDCSSPGDSVRTKRPFADSPADAFGPTSSRPLSATDVETLDDTLHSGSTLVESRGSARAVKTGSVRPTLDPTQPLPAQSRVPRNERSIPRHEEPTRTDFQGGQTAGGCAPALDETLPGDRPREIAEMVRKCRRYASPAGRERWDQALEIAERFLDDNPEVRSRLKGDYEVYIALKSEREGSASQLAAEALNNSGAFTNPDQLSKAAEATGVKLRPRRAAREIQQGLKQLQIGNASSGRRNPNVDRYGESDEAFLERADEILREARQQSPPAKAPPTGHDAPPLPPSAPASPRGPSSEFPNGISVEFPPQKGIRNTCRSSPASKLPEPDKTFQHSATNKMKSIAPQEDRSPHARKCTPKENAHPTSMNGMPRDDSHLLGKSAKAAPCSEPSAPGHPLNNPSDKEPASELDADVARRSDVDHQLADIVHAESAGTSVASTSGVTDRDWVDQAYDEYFRDVPSHLHTS